MFFYFWFIMAAAMMPTASYASPRLERVVTPAPVVQTQVMQTQVIAPRKRKPVSPPPEAVALPPRRELMTLGWVDEDEAPIF